MEHASSAGPIPHVLIDRDEIHVAVGDSRQLIAGALAGVMASQPGLQVTVIGGSDRGEIEALIADEPDVVLIGTGPRVDEAIEFAVAVRAVLPSPGLVFIADEMQTELVEFVLADGRSGLVMTDFSAEDMVTCVRQVVAGGTVLPSGWQRARAAEESSPLRALSQRQLEVLRLLAEGLSYGEIAATLFISVNTVKFHIKAIFLALGVRNRTAAVRLLGSATRN